MPRQLNFKIHFSDQDIVFTMTLYDFTELFDYDKYAQVTAIGKGKGKAIPLQAWTGPEGSRRLRLPDFKTIGT
jgi:hypothetical protein